MPPAPRAETISYGPRRVPAVRAKRLPGIIWRSGSAPCDYSRFCWAFVFQGKFANEWLTRFRTRPTYTSPRPFHNAIGVRMMTSDRKLAAPALGLALLAGI